MAKVPPGALRGLGRASAQELGCAGRCALSWLLSVSLILAGCAGGGGGAAPPTLLSIAVSPANPSIPVGGTQQFTATGTSSDGSTQNLTNSVTWTSSAPGVATINSAGLATGVSAGSTTITAASGTVNGPSRLTVTNPPPAIADFNPKSASAGTLVNVTGSNFASSGSPPPQVTLSKQGGGTISAPISSFTATTIAFVIPTGAATGPFNVAVGTQSVTSSAALSITASSSFGLTAAPSTANLIQGQSTAIAVTLTSTNGFSNLAALSVSGLPAGVTASFSQTQVTAGQTSILTLAAPAGQAVGSATLTISAAASVQGIAETQSASATLMVLAASTGFTGRTVVDDTIETPIAGVTVTFLGVDDNATPTGCTGTTRSDAAGNFLFVNLPAACVGRQLVRYNGTTATAPPGTYAGVDLVYAIVAGQITTAQPLVHLPRIDDKETVMVQQNAASDQTFNFASIPGLSVTVYAHTIFTLVNGTQPNPFPLTAVQVPVDRLPDVKPPNPNMLMVFIVAFQPANATASQPVAVTFPNTINTPPGINMVLMTLDPTKGTMVMYGTGTVSSDATQIIPDLDPAHPGHRFGLVHFDWHGPMPPPGGGSGPGPGGGGCGACCPADGGDGSGPGGGPDGGGGPSGGGPGPFGPSGPENGQPIDLSSGLAIVRATDLAINGRRGSIMLARVYRTLSNNPGPFGIGTGHNYGYQLNTFNFIQGQGLITLIMPNGNQFPFNLQPNGTFTNSRIPALRGAVMTNPSTGAYSLRRRDGTRFLFQSPPNGPRVAYLNSITDANGNSVTLAHGNPSLPDQITQVTDPVGRSLRLTYDSSGRVTSVSDPVGRTVTYTYNSQGTLAMVTDAARGATTYTYDTQNRLTQERDARGVVVAQNTYDVNGRVSQQVQADGGVIKFAYTLLNSTAPAVSPVLLTTVTDPLGNTTTYHWDPTGFLLDVTDPTGQMRVFTHDPQHNNLVAAVAGGGSCSACGNTTIGTQTFTYDANGNVATKTDALGNTTTYTYEPLFAKLTSITDPLGNTTRYTYDAFGHVLTTMDPNGHTTSYAHNSFGQVTQITDALGQTTTYSYDASGNVAAITDPLGNTTTYAYDGVSRLVQRQDPRGLITTGSYDALDRRTTKRNSQGNATQLTYDPVGHPLSLADEQGQTTSFTYDSFGRPVSRTDPRGKTNTFSYDLNGNLIKVVDRRGQNSTFAYDALNRQTRQTYQDGSTVTSSYDASGRLVHAVDSVGGTFDFTYDLAGQLTSSASQLGTVQFSYDATGRVRSRQVVGQSAVTYAYDAVGNLRSASLPQASANFSYDGRNKLLSLARSNGVSSQYAYDTAGRLLSIAHSGGQGIQIPLTYTYDAADNRSLYTTNAVTPQAVTNTFDAAHRLVQSGPTTYAYDDNGNLISATDSSGTTTYAWDARNRLQSISAPGQRTTFLYDFAGNLVSQADSGPALDLTQNFVLDGFSNVAYINRSNGDSLSILAGRGIDSHLAAVHSSGQVEYGLADAQNSTIATADQNGAVASSFSYEPFGQTTTTSTYPFRFTGRVPAAVGLYYYRARYCDSRLGRFISEDPIGFAGASTLLYKYAGNSPFSHSDPSGLQNVGPKGGGGPNPLCFSPYSPSPQELGNLAVQKLACVACIFQLLSVSVDLSAAGQAISGPFCASCFTPQGPIGSTCKPGPPPDRTPPDPCAPDPNGDVSIPCNPAPSCRDPGQSRGPNP